MSAPEVQALALALAHEGLIQFGRFVQPDGSVWPVALRLGWLPSYPGLLRMAAGALQPLLERSSADRLLTTAEAIPLGTALSLYSGVPMTYLYGAVRDYTAAYAIEGAYDVGHPTALLTDVLIDGAQAEAITRLARGVGLEVQTVLALIELGRGAREALEQGGHRVLTVLTLGASLPALEAGGLLPPRMRQTVAAWIAGVGEGA